MKAVVLSPHLDDAVMSIGGTVHEMCSRGVDVDVVTIFAGDPARLAPPSYWDQRRGTATASEATAARRVEDAAATAELGVRSSAWLPFDDIAYLSRRDPDEVWAAIAPHVAGADLVLVPGWPLIHIDHRFTAMIAIERLLPAVPVVFYAEFPYAAQPMATIRRVLRGRHSNVLRHAFTEQPAWRSLHLARPQRQAKQRAVEAYAGELAALGREATIFRWHATVVRRELVGILPGHPPPAGSLLP